VSMEQLVEAGLITDPGSAKGRLLSTAARLFRDKGYSRTTVRDLANELGILSGSLFHHYPNKEAILQAVIEESIRRVLARMQDALAQADSVSDKFRALLHCESEAIHGLLEPGGVAPSEQGEPDSDSCVTHCLRRSVERGAGSDVC